MSTFSALIPNPITMHLADSAVPDDGSLGVLYHLIPGDDTAAEMPEENK